MSHFKHSNVAYDAYRSAQNSPNNDTPKRKLVQLVKTRWNSVYHMIDRLIEQRSAVTAVLNNRSITSSQIACGLEIAEKEWQLLEELRDCLVPFEKATKIMSSENSPTASIIQPLTFSIRTNFLGTNDKDSASLRIFKSVIRNDFVKRFSIDPTHQHSLMGNFSSTLLDFCTFLDPRYKKYEREFGIINRVKDSLIETLKTMDNVFDQGETDNSYKKKEETRTAFDFLFPTNGQNGNVVTCEVSVYADEVQIDKNIDPIIWWKKNEPRFPKLSQLSKKYLCILGTSTPAERAFSKAGNIITAKRNCLSGKTADMLIFLAHNSKVQ